MLCLFSSISSPGMMDLENEVLVAFRQSDHSSASRPAGAIFVEKNFIHSGGSISVEGSSAEWSGGAVLWRAPLELLGTVPYVCGDCSPLDTLLGFGKKLVIRLRRFS